MSFAKLLGGLFNKGEPCTPGVIELLYRWYGRSVYYASYYVLHDQYLAEDVTQEVFLTALNKLDTLRDPTKVEAWLIRTAINRSCDWLRKNRPMLALDEVADKQEEDVVLDPILEREQERNPRSSLPAAYTKPGGRLLQVLPRLLLFHQQNSGLGGHQIRACERLGLERLGMLFTKRYGTGLCGTQAG